MPGSLMRKGSVTTMIRFWNAITEGLIFGFTFAVGWIAAALLLGTVLA
jgi:hypothetical protein